MPEIGDQRIVGSMNDEDDVAWRALPTLHAVALRLDAGGADATEIARVLGIDPDSVAGVLLIARRKLDEARRLALTPREPPCNATPPR